MKERMSIYYLDQDYQNYIRPHTKGKQDAVSVDSKRRTSGVVLFGFGGTTNYFIPLHTGENLDSKRVEMGLLHGLNKGKSGYLDFSAMLPVQNKDLHLMDITNLPACSLKRTLQRQARYVQREQKKIMEGAAEVYLHCVHYPESKIAAECNDVLLLEEKEYLWREGKAVKPKKEESKEKPDTKKNEAKVVPIEKTYRDSSTYKKAVEKYGKKTADKMVAEVLAKALAQEKKEVEPKTKTERSVSSATMSKNTAKKKPAQASKKSATDKGTVTTVTIKSSPAKGK